MSRRWIKGTILAGLTVLSAVAAAGQICTGGIRVEGTITDPTGAVIPGARVQAASGERTDADASGHYVLPCVAGIPARITAQFPGFTSVTSVKNGLRGGTVQFDLKLLMALQMQLEPHFLFNTLNAITSLVAQGRNAEAMKTLGHLHTILRATLQRKAPERVPFADELRVVESYLAIQQVRFAGRLQVEIDTAPDALDGLVPCFILRPLVENAIQHGIAPRATGGLVEARVKQVGDMLWMQVKDNGCGPGSSGTKGNGIGMKNTRERLAYFYPGAHQFHATAHDDGG
jgi:hypothetical protein